MVRISVEVSNGAARFSVSVQAESIERALEIVERQNSSKDCRITFPIDAEAVLRRRRHRRGSGSVNRSVRPVALASNIAKETKKG